MRRRPLLLLNPMRITPDFITLIRRLPPLLGILLMALALLIASRTSAKDSSGSPRDFTLSIPTSFDKSVRVEHHRKGEDIFPPYRLITAAPMTSWYGRKLADPSHWHGWCVRVYATVNSKLIDAYAKAHDGFEANLNEGREFLGVRAAEFDTFARFARKHFRWGNAVSFLHSTYQDGLDGGAMYVPDNDHLSYEVWGVTRDGQYTVVASMGVSHPKLAKWPRVRVANNIEALKRDRDYKIIEKCRAEEFEPSLTAFDQLVDSLKMR